MVDTVYGMFYMGDCKGLHDCCCGSLARLMLALLTADKLLLWTSSTSETDLDTDTESHQQFYHQFCVRFCCAFSINGL